ncbi:hypothetical protein ACQY0O_002066 [Thecaphora frezii]
MRARIDGPTLVVAAPTTNNFGLAVGETIDNVAKAVSHAATDHTNALNRHVNLLPPPTYSQGWMPPENVDPNAHLIYFSDAPNFYPGYLSESGHGGSLHHAEPVDYHQTTTFGLDGAPGQDFTLIQGGYAPTLQPEYHPTATYGHNGLPRVEHNYHQPSALGHLYPQSTMFGHVAYSPKVGSGALRHWKHGEITRLGSGAQAGMQDMGYTQMEGRPARAAANTLGAKAEMVQSDLTALEQSLLEEGENLLSPGRLAKLSKVKTGKLESPQDAKGWEVYGDQPLFNWRY